jgi:nitroreductase
MMDTLEAIRTRRSIRQFTAEPVTDEEIELLLRAAMAAPSASNERPWRFVVVRQREALDRLAKATLYAKPLQRATLGIVVCADKREAKYAGFPIIDCAAAIENLLLAAHSLGLGGVWIGVHPVAPFVYAVRRAIGAPRHVLPHSLLAIGRPAEEKPAVDRYETDWVHQERW